MRNSGVIIGHDLRFGGRPPRWRKTALKRRWLALLSLAMAVLLGGTGALAAMGASPARLWSDPAAPDAAEVALLPIEQGDLNFPGSAFYYLPAEPVPDVAEDADPADLPRPWHAAGTARDQARALQCLTSAIYYEAATEPDAGQRAVAQVVLNRARHPSYPDTVCGVVYQGSERSTGCQFTFTCDGSLARAPAALYWQRARKVAAEALAGSVYAPAGFATHYHTTEVSPYWAPSLDFLGTIGAHRFYRWQGLAGKANAFHARYAGGEPVAAPHPRALGPMAPAPDPIQLAAAYAAEQAHEPATPAADPSPRAAPMNTPRYSAEALARGGDSAFAGSSLPEASGVKPEYRNSGRWIGTPRN